MLFIPQGVPEDVVVLGLDEDLPDSGSNMILVGHPRIAGTPWAVTRGTMSGQNGGYITVTGTFSEGNSGGPVILGGKAVGIMTDVFGDYGYAVPAAQVSTTLRGWGVSIASKEPPLPNTSLVASAAYFGSDGANFSFSSDIAATFECQVDGAGWKSCVSPHGVRGVEDGRHTFEVRAVNTLEQPDPTPEQTSWVSDTGPPRISMSVETSSVTVRDHRTNPMTVKEQIEYIVNFTVKDELSRIAKNECRVGGRQYVNCQSPWRGSGTSTLERVSIRSTDSVGNVRETRCIPSPSCDVVNAVRRR